MPKGRPVTRTSNTRSSIAAGGRLGAWRLLSALCSVTTLIVAATADIPGTSRNLIGAGEAFEIHALPCLPSVVCGGSQSSRNRRNPRA